MSTERELDVSMLEPPEPLQKIIDTIETLTPGEYLKVLHHREPYPLYPILEKEGFSYNSRMGSVTPFEIFIWRMDDAEAASGVEQAMTAGS